MLAFKQRSFKIQEEGPFCFLLRKRKKKKIIKNLNCALKTFLIIIMSNILVNFTEYFSRPKIHSNDKSTYLLNVLR